MENNLKNELNRMFTLMGYSDSENNNFIKEGEYTEKKEEKSEFPFKMARIGGAIRIEDGNTGNKIDIDVNLKDQFIQKLSEFRTI